MVERNLLEKRPAITIALEAIQLQSSLEVVERNLLEKRGADSVTVLSETQLQSSLKVVTESNLLGSGRRLP